MDTDNRTPGFDADVVQRLARRAFVLATKMIDDANHRPGGQRGDPKVGGHPAACSSCIHLLSALRLAVAGPFDTFAIKPHASPDDHALNFLLGLLRDKAAGRWMSLKESQAAMTRLRAFPQHGEPVFQSYHAESDPDSHNYFPTGSVGIPPVLSMYTALAWRYARDHGGEVPPDAHHWSLLGDSEFREGSLMEAMPDAAERELREVTWIVDYNRQNLDGSRIPNDRSLHGTDAERMERVARANGWDCIQVRHGRVRRRLFAQQGGERLREVLERGFTDYELTSLLFKRDAADVRAHLQQKDRRLEPLLGRLSDEALWEAFQDLGGHDVPAIVEALEQARRAPVPVLVVAHTIKGWGLSSWAHPGNHSMLPPREEVAELLRSEGLDERTPYRRFPEGSEEQRWLDERGERLRRGVEEQLALRERNRRAFAQALEAGGGLPTSVGVDLKMVPLAHTQYVWGQAAGRLVRIGSSGENRRHGGPGADGLSDEERRWEAAAEYIVTMAPDVGTSTNTNPAMNERVYGPTPEEDWERALEIRDARRPGLMPHEAAWTRHIRFEIAEANCMSAAGAFGKLRDWLGLPYLPFMTIYDFFIKRAFDQLYLDLYMGSRFVVIGTPSGVSLSPEGAQHSWKSDIQMPNLVTWEPAYGVEVDWILAETVRRAVTGDDEGRTGVLLRCTTRALDQRELLVRLRRHARFKAEDRGPLAPAHAGEGFSGTPEAEVAPVPDAQLLEALRPDVLRGGYRLVDYRGYAGYEPGENVVHLVAMGAVVTEALEASDRLLAQGVFADVVVCTSPTLLADGLGLADGYRHLREGLGVDGTLHVAPRGDGSGRVPLESEAALAEVAAARVPIVSVTDGEAGLLDNLGAIAGVPQEALAVRKPGKSGRPAEVYRYEHLDAGAVEHAALGLLERLAEARFALSPALAERAGERRPAVYEQHPPAS